MKELISPMFVSNGIGNGWPSNDGSSGWGFGGGETNRSIIITEDTKGFGFGRKPYITSSNRGGGGGYASGAPIFDEVSYRKPSTGDGSGNSSGKSFTTDGYGIGSGSCRNRELCRITGGRLLKLTDMNLKTYNEFVWPRQGMAISHGPFDYKNEETCPSTPGDGLCAGITISALISSGIAILNSESEIVGRVLIVDVDPKDVLGSNATKLRAKKMKVVREATEEEIFRFIEYLSKG